MSKVEWMDPPDARFRTDIDTSWAPELMDNPEKWARVLQDEDQRVAYQLRTNLKNRLTHLYPGKSFELICRRSDDGQVTAIFARYLGVATDLAVAGTEPVEEENQQSPDEEADE